MSTIATNALLSSTANYLQSAVANVAAIAFHAMLNGTKASNKADTVADMMAVGMTQSTAYRQAGFGFHIATTVKAKCIDHPRIVEAKLAGSEKDMLAAMVGFLADMGIQDAKDSLLFSGAPVDVKAKAELRTVKVKL